MVHIPLPFQVINVIYPSIEPLLTLLVMIVSNVLLSFLHGNAVTKNMLLTIKFS